MKSTIQLFILLACMTQLLPGFADENQPAASSTVNTDVNPTVTQKPQEGQADSIENKWSEKILAGDAAMDKHDYSTAIAEYKSSLLLAQSDIRNTKKTASSNVKLGRAYLVLSPLNLNTAQEYFQYALNQPDIDSTTKTAARKGLSRCRKILAQQEQEQQPMNMSRLGSRQRWASALSQTGMAIQNIAPNSGYNSYPSTPIRTIYTPNMFGSYSTTFIPGQQPIRTIYTPNMFGGYSTTY